ncbi:MAG: glycerol-3-phosphate dehydrogenase [Armatimonadetes bacterium]|nr:glycerol-3-phosphate dehydrogenase [Armatimonadota bacterium]
MSGKTVLYDLVIIGGGINGAGIARDAAERGLSVCLLERSDFGAGTSAHSTRLIHGGLRYLEHFEFGLVRESLREREVLLRIAPHLVAPTAFAIPIYRGGPYNFTKVRLGLLLYDTLAVGRSLPSHQALSRSKFLRLEPEIDPTGLEGGFLYYDCQINYPERLCVENILSAARAGARIENHAEVTAFLREGGQVSGVRARHRLTGQEETVRSRFVVNAAGPWLDAVCDLLDRPAPRKLGGTKGSHLVVRQREGLPNAPVYTPARADGRPFFILPWREFMLIGTTDIPFDGDLDTLVADEQEIEYLIREANALLPRARLQRDDILYTFAGVRPLPPGDSDAGKRTRRHFLYDHEREDGIFGLVSIIGGKLTTYRSLAEETVGIVFRKLGRAAPPSATHTLPLYGGEIETTFQEYIAHQAETASQRYGIAPSTARHLISLYGSRHEDVLARAEHSPELKDPITPDLPDIGAQAAYGAERELVRTLEDFLLRRTGIGMGADCGLSAAPACARLLARHLSWDEKRIERELDEYRKVAARRRLCRD